MYLRSWSCGGIGEWEEGVIGDDVGLDIGRGRAANARRDWVRVRKGGVEVVVSFSAVLIGPKVESVGERSVVSVL
jgi:hypothetical protein